MKFFLHVLENIILGLGSIGIAGYTLYLYSVKSIGKFGVIMGIVFFMFSLLLQSDWSSTKK